MGAASAPAAAGMLLLDSTTLAVYEIDDAALVMPNALPPPVAFEYFESAARSHLHNPSHMALFPAFRIQSKTLVFVKLANGRGWAWASRIRVVHGDEFPIRCGSIGGDFLFLWPAPMAINAYLSFRDRWWRTFATEWPEEVARFALHVQRHPPSMSSAVGPRAGGAVGVGRKLRAMDLTVAQRLFVSSLAPHTAVFAVRSRTDRWSETLGDEDRRHLYHFSATATATAATAAAAAAATGARARCLQRRRRRGGGAARSAFDLSDDAAERVACVHLAQSMASLAEMGGAVAQLRLVSQQFRRATDAALQQLVRAASGAACSLLGDYPREPVSVQAVVHAAGLTLRRALALKDGDGWRAYARARAQVERCDGARLGPEPEGAAARERVARERKRLLWSVDVP
jgi:hypothetical protein